MAEVLDSAQATPLPFPTSNEEASLLEETQVPSSSSNAPTTSGNESGPSTSGGSSSYQNEGASTSAGPSVQRVTRVYSSTAEAIANFKPTPRQVISGIAPHVFDERKRRRSQTFRRAPKPYWYSNGEKRSSPLRGATVISWDEHSIYLEQSPDHIRSASLEIVSNELPTVKHHTRDTDSYSTTSQMADRQQRAVLNTRHAKPGKAGWKYFRVDVRLLKTIVFKLKLTTTSPESRKSTRS
ncbi:hypothetical protein CPC08DRAFT_117720 [Agrocybe pediades]|nr:hypothetical protein CPC08DRAFT_117720 [Agrocybe pediades]